MGQEDHFFRDARPGLARFSPGVAIAKQREYAASALTRDGRIRTIAVTSLERHSAALDRATAELVLDHAAATSAPRDPNMPDSRDVWVSSQYAIQVGFPHLTGDEQIDFLAALPAHGSPLLKFADVLKPASPDKLATLLRDAVSGGDENRQLAALMVASYSGTALNENALKAVGHLSLSERSSVRAVAFNAIANADDSQLVRAVAESGWSAAALDQRENSFERWYGSLVLVAAARHGSLREDGLLDRITPELYGHAASALGSQMQAAVSARLRQALQRALDLDLQFTPPMVSQTTSDSLQRGPALRELADPPQEEGFEAFIKRMNETDEEFDARQKSGWATFGEFDKLLTEHQARLIVDDVGAAGVKALVEASPEDGKGLARTLLDLERRKLSRVSNFGFRLARAVSRYDGAIARQLFDRLAGERGTVKLTYGVAAVPLELLSIWGSADHPDLDSLRLARLDNAANDFDLSQEVLAALMAKKSEALDRYVQARLQSPVPADNARALMVLGFGLESPFADEKLGRSSSPEGIIGKAQEAALFAYQRNRWTRHWFERMASTDDPQDFWRFGVLFAKIADARFEIWQSDVVRAGTALDAFAPAIEGQLKRRVGAWKTHREKTLCGDKIAGDIFSLSRS